MSTVVSCQPECNRIQHSYIELPASFKFGQCSGREGDPICERELNDRYVGVPPLVRGRKIAIMPNLSKAILLMGEDRLYEIGIVVYQAKMSLRYLEDFLSSEGPKKDAALKKFRRHAGSLDSYFREADISSDLTNIKQQLIALVLAAHRRSVAEKSSCQKRLNSTPNAAPHCSRSLSTSSSTTSSTKTSVTSPK